MKNKILIGGLAAALLVTGACSSPSTTNNTTNANRATNTTTTTTTTSNTNTASAPANTNSATSNTSSTAEGKQDFTLVNATGVEIDKVFISPHDSNDWEEDILGRDTLPDGESVDIKFQRNEKAAMWDLRV